MRIRVHFTNGRTEESDHLTAADADNYVNTLEDVVMYEIVLQNEENNNNA